ncbi:GM10880, partial [Drosophila sechellia]
FKYVLLVVAVFVCLTRQCIGQLHSEQLLAVLKASGDDPKTPLIVLSNPTIRPAFGESIKSEPDMETTIIPDFATTISPASFTTASTEKRNKKTRPPQMQKAGPNYEPKQRFSMQDLLLMPGIWESSPIVDQGPMTTQNAQPVFYPVPVYIPYPMPFMLNPQIHLMSRPSKDKVDDQIAMGFHGMMGENLVGSSFQQDNGSDWHKIIGNRVKPVSQDDPKKWRGKWRKTTTTTTTTSTTEAPVTMSTEATRLLSESSNQSDTVLKSIETNENNETTAAAS